MAAEPDSGSSPGRCVICGKPMIAAFKPFCSARCRDVDLHRWLSGSYAIPGRPEEDEDGEGAQRPPGETPD